MSSALRGVFAEVLFGVRSVVEVDLIYVQGVRKSLFFYSRRTYGRRGHTSYPLCSVKSRHLRSIKSSERRIFICTREKSWLLRRWTKKCKTTSVPLKPTAAVSSL